VARELTKVHQEFIRGDSAAVLSSLAVPKGEFTVVVSNELGLTTKLDAPDADTVVASYHRATSGGLGRRAAISLAAKEFGLSSREVYALIESSRNAVIQQNVTTHLEPLKKLAD
jgi:16S rRNA C1402 (ribose-2'-O) methylase RsmI